MAWFKVDDKMPNHRKARAVRRSHPSKGRDASPFGLWVLAGAWAGSNNTAGFVPSEVLADWDDEWQSLTDRLVAAGLFWRTEQDGEPGFGFHDWGDMNPVSENSVTPSASGALGNHVRWHEKRGKRVEGCGYCFPDRGDIAPDSGPDDRGESQNIASGIAPVPTRPDPTRPDKDDDSRNVATRSSSSAFADGTPIPEPPDHIDATPPRKAQPSSAARTVVRQELGANGYPRGTLDRLAVQVGKLAHQNIADDVIRESLREWERRKGAKPEWLETIAGDVVQARRSVTPITKPSKLRGIAELAAAARAQESNHQQEIAQ